MHQFNVTVHDNAGSICGARYITEAESLDAAQEEARSKYPEAHEILIVQRAPRGVSK